MGNIKGWFNNPAGKSEQVSKLELLHDVKLHWNSTYAMINWLYALQLVCMSFKYLGSWLKAINYFLELQVKRSWQNIFCSDHNGKSLKTLNISFRYVL